MLDEFEWIRRMRTGLPVGNDVVTGAGDDCAVLDLGIPGEWALFKTDAVVEGIHFESGTEAERVGHKALARCLSDIAAMGGTPHSALVTVAVPESCPVDWLDAAYEGLSQLARRYDVSIVGGETTTNPERRILSVCVLGKVPRESVLHRHGSQPDDALFVTGELGGSLAGHHLDFEPRLVEGQWLAKTGWVHAMIDLSDGLAGDLPHLLQEGRDSPLGAEVRAESLPIRRAARQLAKTKELARPAVLAALVDGEDFELLFTVPARHAVPLLDAWKLQFPEVPLTCVGRIEPNPGLWLRDSRGRHRLPEGGYRHFSQ